MLSGDIRGAKDIFVDNFILVEMERGSWFQLLGYGTADSLPSSGTMYVGRDPVAFTSFAPWGMAQFKPIDLTSKLPEKPGLSSGAIDIRVTSLDCGVIGQTSDVFLLFQ